MLCPESSNATAEPEKNNSNVVPSLAATPSPQALVHSPLSEVFLSLLLTVTAREYPAPADRVMLPDCITNVSECNSAIVATNSVAEDASHSDQSVNTRNWRRSISSRNNRNSLISIDSEYKSDSLGNMTQFNDTTFLGQIGLRTNSDSGTTVGQFDGRNRTVTGHSVRSKRQSRIAMKTGSNIIGDDSSAKNELQLRTRKFIASNKSTNYFWNLWKSVITQGNSIFSGVHNVRGRSGIQDRVLLRGAVSVDDILVQNRGKRATQDDNGTTMTEENPVSEPAHHSDATSLDANGDREPEQCFAPEYIVYTWVLCLVALATALKLYYLVKTTLASAMVTVFTTLILVAYKEVFDKE